MGQGNGYLISLTHLLVAKVQQIVFEVVVLRLVVSLPHLIEVSVQLVIVLRLVAFLPHLSEVRVQLVIESTALSLLLLLLILHATASIVETEQVLLSQGLRFEELALQVDEVLRLFRLLSWLNDLRVTQILVALPHDNRPDSGTVVPFPLKQFRYVLRVLKGLNLVLSGGD